MQPDPEGSKVAGNGDSDKTYRNTHVDGATGKSFAIVRQYAESKTISWKVQRIVRKNRLPYSPHAKFLPHTEISRQVGRQAVLLELSRSMTTLPPDSDPEEYQKILTILYLMKQPEKIDLFVKAGVTDQHLPLEYQPYDEKREVRTGLGSLKTPDSPSIFFDGSEDAEDFVELQWGVLAHVFAIPDNTIIPQYQLDPRQILPFNKYRQVTWKGGSGEVFKAKIHPDYHFWNESKVRTLVWCGQNHCLTHSRSTRKGNTATSSRLKC